MVIHCDLSIDAKFVHFINVNEAPVHLVDKCFGVRMSYFGATDIAVLNLIHQVRA